MDPVEPWIDTEEVKRLARQLISRTQTRPPEREEPGFGPRFEGFLVSASNEASRAHVAAMPQDLPEPPPLAAGPPQENEVASPVTPAAAAMDEGPQVEPEVRPQKNPRYESEFEDLDDIDELGDLDDLGIAEPKRDPDSPFPGIPPRRNAAPSPELRMISAAPEKPNDPPTPEEVPAVDTEADDSPPPPSPSPAEIPQAPGEDPEQEIPAQHQSHETGAERQNLEKPQAAIESHRDDAPKPFLGAAAPAASTAQEPQKVEEQHLSEHQPDDQYPPLQAHADTQPKQRGPLLERMDRFKAWLTTKVGAKGLFVLDRDGAPVIDDPKFNKLHFLAKSLAQAHRVGDTDTGNVHVKIGSEAYLAVIPVETAFGTLVLGAILPAPLDPAAVKIVAKGLAEASRPAHR